MPAMLLAIGSSEIINMVSADLQQPSWRLQMFIVLHAPPPPQPFYSPFSGTTRVSQCQKRTSGLYGARGD